ncbi:type I polyketide synthase [Bosea sp. Leaf344]|uniref:type I polyketide synthase n=1 Tax=Bosea sp. Leaf344 TaxID=1736346 RepID=UPI0009E72430|nr:type I polyketide synthase [Bosea sp. Leaf344]
MSDFTSAILGDIGIVGYACNLPGSNSIDALWDVLLKERNVVSPRPIGRWSVERFLRAGKPVPGFSYSFAGGYIDAPFAFDPAPFGISPREAQQMDPQQRLLLETTWKALEDAGVPPSSLAGHNVGVYVGASLVDYQSGGGYDPAVIGSHFMTGNALSILSNRISYVFDLKGPSFTLDSACSSSFVALSQAMRALDLGEIDMAVVGGVNMLLSPAPFIGFSQARMLSPTGLCRPFSDEADGYVRSEGAVVLILQRLSDAQSSGRRVRSVVMAAAINSDGRTNGISLPSQHGQQSLIESLYAAAGVHPERLAFVEAHGTGTKVGDPIEASAIGASLGQNRSTPLPIGSIKSNIGHLEAASGLAGLLKASMAIEHCVVPRSLFAETPNAAIDFPGLNIAPIVSARLIQPQNDEIFAGVCNYGFGGTNAHVILRSAPKRSARCVRLATGFGPGAPEGKQAEILLVSAATAEALSVRSQQIAATLSEGVPATNIASTLAYRHEILSHRLAVPLPDVAADNDATVAILQAFANGGLDASKATSATAALIDRKPIFVFSGNGAQYPAMGEVAYQASSAFRREIEEIDALYRPIAGWSIAEQFRDGVSRDVLDTTSRTQPLLFAVQSALAAVLKRYGFHPSAVLGHSVGEIAAAECCGFLSRADALRVVHLRSEHQEGMRGRGRMLVIATNPDSTQDLIDRAQAASVDIAAYNSSLSTTVSGPADEIAAIAALARRERIASITLKVEYPFHSRALDFLEQRIIDDFAEIRATPAHTPFFSTVTGKRLSIGELGARYWWDNVRRPVRFQQAIEEALDGYPDAAFVEITPRQILLGPMADILQQKQVRNPILATLSSTDKPQQDPIRTITARFVAHGLAHDRRAVFGEPPGNVVVLPGYPMQREEFHLGSTSEAINSYGRLIESVPLHPLLGSRAAAGSPEWRCLLDPVLVPYLNDHRVDGTIVLPAAALIDMALAVGSEILGDGPIEVDEFDILKALTFAEDETRELSTRYSSQSGTVEIWSRRRLAGNEWLLHARGTVRRIEPSAAPPRAIPSPRDPILDVAEDIYAEANRAGLEYGSYFQVAESSERDHTICRSALKVPSGGLGAYDNLHVLHPVSLDGAFHTLFLARPQRDGERKAFLPIRFRHIRVWKPGAAVAQSVTELKEESSRFKSISVFLLGEDGQIVATIDAAVFRSVHLIKPFMADRTFREEAIVIDTVPLPSLLPEGTGSPGDLASIRSLVKALSISLARELAAELLAAETNRTFEALAEEGAIPPAAQPLWWRIQQVLELAGAVEKAVEGKRLSPTFMIPSPQAILGTLIQRFPRANMEIRLAAQAMAEAGKLLRSGTLPAKQPDFPTDHWGLVCLADPLRGAVQQAIAKLLKSAPCKLRILIAGDWNAALSAALKPSIESGQISATLIVANQVRADDQRHLPGIGTLLELLVLESGSTGPTTDFDALIGFSLPGSPAGLASPGLLERCVAMLGDGAPILLGEPVEDAYLSFLLHASTPAIEQMAGEAAGGGHDAIDQQLAKARVVDRTVGLTEDGILRLFGGRAAREANRNATLAASVAVIAHSSSGDLIPVYGLKAGVQLASENFAAFDAWLGALQQDTPAILIFAPYRADVAARNLTSHLDVLTNWLLKLGNLGQPCRLFVLTEGARTGDAESAPANAAVLGFVRVAINEFPDLDIRTIDIERPAAAARVQDILATGSAEREWRITASGLTVTRVRRGMITDSALTSDDRSVLHFADGVGLDGFEWLKKTRPAPDEGEIEVEVAAAGLNYRDVLVGLGILDDDLLGAGMTRAALGFECSGIVVRVGPGVTQHRVGDAVMGFAAQAFSSHVVCPDWHFFPVPEGMSLEAAATIPVAFATAWYALVERGQIRGGEDVLVHGAAGGVGLAAIQIAKLKKARVLGTASSGTRRTIAQGAGADMIFDSRQERFAADIKERFHGVDVVLNSLAGDAMLASFKLLKPFGRFLELGKRDFLDNTQLALRPFLHNIAYSGIDLDELLAAKPQLAREMMASLAELFTRQALLPLTYRTFESHEAGAAFRSMQASEHVGKIVIRPASSARADIASLSYAARAGLYLVVGGTAGLGLATAHWLSRMGASHIALVSRRGQVEEALSPLVAEMERHGAHVLVRQLDVTDAMAVHSLISELSESYGPVRGVVHAAVHLDDGLIANLTPTRLHAVLRTKVDGIINLDAATEGQPLDFFVAYSSATTMVGSPGQAAYVAANAFLEGFMRRRRKLGKPALAIGWGAISDVGIIARDKQLGQRLRRTTGVVAMRSSEALAHLGRLISLGDTIDPVQFLTNIAQSAGAEKLALLKSPAFVGLGLIKRDGQQGPTDEAAFDLRGKSASEAVEIVTGILRREVSEILRMPESKIDLSQPLIDIGLDSLMALELHMSLETALGVQIAVVGAGDRNLAAMARMIVDQINHGDNQPPQEAADSLPATVATLAGIHSTADLSPEEASKLERAVRASRRGAF